MTVLPSCIWRISSPPFSLSISFIVYCLKYHEQGSSILHLVNAQRMQPSQSCARRTLRSLRPQLYCSGADRSWASGRRLRRPKGLLSWILDPHVGVPSIPERKRGSRHVAFFHQKAPASALIAFATRVARTPCELRGKPLRQTKIRHSSR